MTDRSLTTTPSNSSNVESGAIQLVELHGQPTVRDVDLGARLGFKRPDSIRRVIERNKAEIEGYSTLRQLDATSPMPNGGTKTVTEYHLDEEQALAVCQLSRAPRAVEVRRMLIQTFTAYRRGLLVPDLDRGAVGGIIKSVLAKQLGEVLPVLVEREVEARLKDDPRIAAVEFKPALAAAEELGVPQKGRRGFVLKASNRLRRYSNLHGHPMRQSWPEEKWLFHTDAVRKWINDEGRALAREYIEARSNQPSLLVFRGRTS